MRQFELYGQQVFIPDGLDIYIQEKADFEESCKAVADQFEENAKFYMEPKFLLSDVKNNIKWELQQYISNLSTTNIFDFDVENALQYSKNYCALLSIVTSYYEYQGNVQSREEIIRNIDKKQAEYEAMSTIHGLDFGIISNSLTAHLVYAWQSQSAIKKQAQEAENLYNRLCQNIKVSSNNRIAKECEKYYRNYFINQFRGCLWALFNDIFSMYIVDYAARVGIDLRSISKLNYDYAQAETIIANHSASGRTSKETILLAIQKCPYNLSIYKFAKSKRVFKELEPIFIALDLQDAYDEKYKALKSEKDSILVKEIARLLINNEIDVYDSHWQQRAKSYQADSIALCQKYPNSFVPYGLAMVHTVSANLMTWSTGFWRDVNYYLQKMLSLYSRDDDYAEYWYDISSAFSLYVHEYIEQAHQYVEQQNEEFSRNNPKYDTHSDEQNQWFAVGNYKAFLSQTVSVMVDLIKGFERLGVKGNDWLISNLKNDLLYYVCEFLAPYDMWYSEPDRWVRMQLPLANRQYALGVYDDLIAQGVDKYDGGWFSINKDKAYHTNQAFGDSPNTVWRGEITKAGRWAQGRQSDEDMKQRYSLQAIICGIAAILSIPLFIFSARAGNEVLPFLAVIICISGCIFTGIAIRNLCVKTNLSDKIKKIIVIGPILAVVLIILLLIFIPIAKENNEKNRIIGEVTSYLETEYDFDVTKVELKEDEYWGYSAIVYTSNFDSLSTYEMTRIVYYADIDGVDLGSFKCGDDSYLVFVNSVYKNGKQVSITEDESASESTNPIKPGMTDASINNKHTGTLGKMQGFWHNKGGTLCAFISVDGTTVYWKYHGNDEYNYDNTYKCTLSGNMLVCTEKHGSVVKTTFEFSNNTIIEKKYFQGDTEPSSTRVYYKTSDFEDYYCD